MTTTKTDETRHGSRALGRLGDLLMTLLMSAAFFIPAVWLSWGLFHYLDIAIWWNPKTLDLPGAGWHLIGALCISLVALAPLWIAAAIIKRLAPSS
jgi:hypothetical protein